MPELATEAMLTQHWGMPAELHLRVGLQQPRYIGLIFRCSMGKQHYKAEGRNFVKSRYLFRHKQIKQCYTQKTNYLG